ncbi:hypothetical protein, partial [Lichenifustis flavocetrariae]
YGCYTACTTMTNRGLGAVCHSGKTLVLASLFLLELSQTFVVVDRVLCDLRGIRVQPRMLTAEP